MSHSSVQLANVAPVTWKNGGGFTRELLAWPGADDWVLRLSVAEVDKSGPFSIFVGVHRWFGVLTGAGVRLSAGGQINTVTQDGLLFEFDGGVQHDCDLIAGSTSDFNVMVKANAGPCRVQRIRGEYLIQSSRRFFAAVYANCDKTTIRVTDKNVEPMQLRQGDLYWQIFNAGDSPWQITSTDAICVELAVD